MSEKITVEDVTDYLMEGGFCNNEVSAEVLINNMSDKWLETILGEIQEGFKPLPKEKMARQADKAYRSENDAVRRGDEAGANKHMQRRIAMQNPSVRKVGLENAKRRG